MPSSKVEKQPLIKNPLLYEGLQHLLILFLFLVLTVAYFSPAFEGKVLQQMDITHYKALSHQTQELYEKTGHFSLWNGSLFSGMPNFTITNPPKPNVFNYIKKVFYVLPKYSAAIFFLYLLGFYLLLLTLKIDKWLSAFFSGAFALSSYNIIIIAVGHITKAYSIAFMPMVLASFILIFKYKKYLWGGLAAAVSLGLQISSNHYQILYYTALMVGLYVIYEFIVVLLDSKDYKSFGLGLAVSLVAVILAVLPNTVDMWEYYEGSKYSIRGGQRELVKESNKGKKVKGLDKDYALSWSYGVGESLTLLIPDIKGGASDYIGNDQKLMSKINSPYKPYLAQQMRYWGPQPFTAGPVYFGAIILFLFIFGFWVIKDKIKWWILFTTILALMLSWGKHFMPLTDLFYYYVPLYNKFRVVSMILVIASLLVPLFAVMTVYEIGKNPNIVKEKRNGFLISLALTAGVALIVALFPRIAGPLLSPQEMQFLDNLTKTQTPQVVSQYQSFFNDLESVRAMIVKASAWRSFVFVILAAALVWVYSMLKKTSVYLLYGSLALLVLIDLWAIDRKYLNYNDFEPKRIVKSQFKPTLADQFILKTKEKDYRVLNLTVDPFNDALTSYYHQSIGGYSAAKLRRYQDIIEHYLFPYTQILVKALRDTTGTVNIMQVLKPMQVLHMLNTLYIIVGPNTAPIVNPYAFGNAWFVDGYKFVNSATDEINSLSNVDLKHYAVINKSKFSNVAFPELSLIPDTTRYINLVSYMPDSLVYDYYSRKNEFVVFSEIYYPEGWKATIDGKPAKIVQVDYILRGLAVPPGRHKIVMVFEPKPYTIGYKIAFASSVILVIIVLLAIVLAVFKSKETKKLSDQ